MYMKKSYYFNSYEEDLVESKKQNYELKKDYKWIHNNIIYRLCSSLIYYIFMLVSLVYCKLVLKVTFINRKALKKANNYFVYANHIKCIDFK